MLNVWHPYQVHVTYHWSRAATLIEAGLRDGLGYRDTAQDILGALYSVGSAAKTRIFALLRGQERRGCALHKVQPLTLKVGAGEKVPEGQIWSDDHLWLPLMVGAYVRETGDLGILEEGVPYLDADEGSVYEHLWRALEFSHRQRGAHGLLLCLAADWNDALQLGPDGQSVWVSMQVCLACAEVAEMARLRQQPADAERALAWREEMCTAINRSAWDGQWYLCGLMGDGRTIGSQADEVARIWLNMQTWSVIAGVAERERALQAMDAVHEHLASPYGLHLFAPPHQGYDVDIPGRVCYPPGFKRTRPSSAIRIRGRSSPRRCWDAATTPSRITGIGCPARATMTPSSAGFKRTPIASSSPANGMTRSAPGIIPGSPVPPPGCMSPRCRYRYWGPRHCTG